jgi:putative Ca2+/H+ antiporter (TMEM165/GDT1 family)
MNAILQSFALVFASEMGDKTQLLALILASRFRKPWTIMAGILCATLLNHGLASYVGGYMSETVSPRTLAWVLAIIFFVFAAWILIPDKDDGLKVEPRFGAFLTTLVTFFLAEMGDKTQLATVALGARFNAPVVVTIGTTLGMLGADGLAVFLGEKITKVVPMNYIRYFASALFFIFGLYILLA